MKAENHIIKTRGTPISILFREIEYEAPHSHEDLLEIILCMAGEINVSYYFEDFTIRTGEFIVVDKDVHYLHKGNNAICTSFYIDLSFFRDKYPYVDSLSFVCEGTAESNVPYNTYKHKHLKAMLIALLTYISENTNLNHESEYVIKINNITENIVDLLVEKFDIIFWYHPDLVIQDTLLLRYREMMDYIFHYRTQNINLNFLARKFNLSENYLSEFFSSISLGFRSMLRYVRAVDAARMLLSSDMNILEISEACGFSDSKYLYKAFNEWYNCTPNKFRKMHLDEIKNDDVFKLLQLSDINEPLEKMRKEHYIDWFM